MATKELKTRIALKYDLYSAWTTAPGKDLVLLKGEIGICEIPAVNGDSRVAPTVLFKVGDGVKTFEKLPWASAKAADVYSWAKASNVEVDGKTIKFIGGDLDSDGNKIDKVITLNFATPEEVETVRSGLDSRITAIESSIGTGGTVANDIADLKERLSDAEQDVVDLGNDKLDKSTYETYINGKSMSDAELKAYADSQAAAAKSGAEGTATSALATAKSTLEAADSALGGRIDDVSNRVTALEGDNGAIATGDAATLEAAKAYADGLAGNYDAEGSATTAKSEAIAAAKEYTDGEIDKLEAEDLRLAGLISGNTTAIGNETTARENAVNAINTKIGTVTDGKDVVTMISDAQAAAEANAATTAQSKVDALANGQVKTNKEAIATNAGEITRVEGLVTAEAKAREDADKAIDERLVGVEAFFKTAEGETLDTALDTLKEIQDYLNGEGEATGGMIGRVAQAEADIDDLEKEFADGGRVKVAEGKITALEAKDTELANADTALGQRIDALVGDNGTIATGDAATLASAKSYTDGRETLIRSELKTAYEAYADQAETDAVATAKSYTDGEIDKLEAKDTEIVGNVTTLQNIVDGYTDKGSIKTAVDAAAEVAQTGVDNAATAQAAAEAAQGTANTVKAAVEHATTGLAATKDIADRADAKSVDNASRLDTVEGEIDALQATVDTATTGLKDRMSAAEESITNLQTLTGDASKGNTALYNEVTRVAGLVDNTTTGLAATKVIADRADAAALANDGRLDTIEADYVRIGTDNKMYGGKAGADYIVFSCGSATELI